MATVLALDVGSSSVRAQPFDEQGEPTDELRQEHYDGRDPDQIVALSRKVLDGAEPDGVSCFGHSLIPLGADGKPLTELLGWMLERSGKPGEARQAFRAADELKKFRRPDGDGPPPGDRPPPGRPIR